MLMGPSPAKHPLIHEPILYITNLPASISDQSVADHCRASHVWFDELTIERESNEETVSGTIEFYQVEMAEKAHAILQSRPLSEINPPVHLILSPYPPENSLLDEPPRTTAILVQNLPHGYPESALYNLFRPLGAIDWVWIRTYSGHDTGVVEFWSEDDAYRASRELNGTEVEGQKISIRFPTSGFLTPQRSYSTHRRWSAIYDHPVDETSQVPRSTTCACLREGRHYANTVLDEIIIGTPDGIHHLMFIEEKGFMDQFLRSNQGMGYIEYSPWALTSFSPPSPYRTMSYIKPLDNEPFNVKATDCDIRITIVHEDSTDYTSAILSTTCHDVPSSRDFTIQTRICIMWESLGVTRMIVTTQVEWSGPSYIKDIVERASFEGQQSYYEALHREMTRHIYAHRDEFIPSGVNCNTLPVRCTGCLGLFTVGDTNLDTSTHVLDDDSEMESPIEHDVYGSDLTSCALCGERVHEAPSPVTEDAPTFSGSSTTVVAVESRSAEEVLNVNTADDLQRVLALKNGVDIILTLEDSLVSSTLDLLQSEIRTTVSDPGLYEYRRKCTKCLRGLVNKHHVLPNSLFVNDIVREGSHPVGGGGFSDIWKGTYGDQAVCLKVLRVHIQSNQGKKDKIVREFYKEALLWTQFSHPNLLPFLGVNTELFPQGFCLVSPWMVNGDIISFLESNPAHDKLIVITEIAAGMSYLHSLKVVHGDIKGANVLVDARGVCHLADFGLAITTAETTALFNSTTSATKGSLRWMAPELFNLGIGDLMGAGEEKPNELGRDIYAYACTVLEIITGKPPFPDLIDTMVMFQVAVNGARPPRPTAVTWCPDNIWALVQLCWAQQICLRPAASGVHSYLERLVDARRSGLPWEQEFPQLVVES